MNMSIEPIEPEEPEPPVEQALDESTLDKIAAGGGGYQAEPDTDSV